MELNDAIKSIEEKIYDWRSAMTREEAEVLKENLDDADVKCYYALGLLINSSCTFSRRFGNFEGYDELQKEALGLMDRAISEGSAVAVYYLAQIKCGLFGKFPMFPDEAKELFERLYELTGNENVKNDFIDGWAEFLMQMEARFKELKFTERFRTLGLGPCDLGNHDEAYYENLSENDS
ncbi:MAG: hypothetical protein IJW21_02010 [Clostridia bacterium]|nr:hypothetical protein [Clostridia bacterium]